MRALTFDVRSVASGAEALRELAAATERGAAIEMVLLDWQMPEMDGFEVARRIRADPRLAEKPLVFMITAFGREEMREQESASSRTRSWSSRSAAPPWWTP